MHHFSPSHGGHAPGHLRDLFCGWSETGSVQLEKLSQPPKVPEPLDWLIGKLWNCTDIMSSDVRAELRQRLDPWDQDPEMFTYGQAARRIRAMLDSGFSSLGKPSL